MLFQLSPLASLVILGPQRVPQVTLGLELVLHVPASVLVQQKVDSELVVSNLQVEPSEAAQERVEPSEVAQEREDPASCCSTVPVEALEVASL